MHIKDTCATKITPIKLYSSAMYYQYVNVPICKKHENCKQKNLTPSIVHVSCATSWANFVRNVSCLNWPLYLAKSESNSFANTSWSSCMQTDSDNDADLVVNDSKEYV